MLLAGQFLEKTKNVRFRLVIQLQILGILVTNYGKKKMKQKKYWLLFSLFIMSLLQGCKQINKLTIFNIDYTTESVIGSVVGINLPFNLPVPAIKTNSESEFEINETRRDLIQEITLNRLKLSVSAPENGDLSFLKSITIYINGENLEEKRIAWNENIDTSEKSIQLETTTEDLQEYIKLDTVSLRVNTVVKKLLLTDYTVTIYSEFRVDARILGI